MSTALCAGLDPDMWSTGDQGNRLALAICRRCTGCPDGDPNPHGVIRRGTAFSDFGKPLSLCESCGYPLPGAPSGGTHACPRCSLPSLTRFQASILDWKRDGLTDRQCGQRVGASPEQVRDARRRWVKAEPVPEPCEKQRGDGPVDEVTIERALAGERPELTDVELIAALQAGVARGIPLSRLAEQMGLNYWGARKLVDGQLTPRREKQRRVEAALEANPGLSDWVLGAQIGVHGATVTAARRRIADRAQSAAS